MNNIGMQGIQDMMKGLGGPNGKMPDMSQLSSMMGGMDMSQMSNMMQGMGLGGSSSTSNSPSATRKPKRK
jgi:hypothetical protein